jgi:hypothetical protein
MEETEINPLVDKADSLAKKMNSLTEKFNLSEEMDIQGNDIIDFVDEKTQEITLYTDSTLSTTEIINLDNMVEDFKYIRESLKEVTDNGRRVLGAITLELLDSDDEKRSTLILSFAELNKAVSDNMKLYMQSYKDISTVLLNIDKIEKGKLPKGPNTINNTVNIIEPISTVDLIQELKGK